LFLGQGALNLFFFQSAIKDQGKKQPTDFPAFRFFFGRPMGLCASAMGMAPHLGTSSWLLAGFSFAS
jgi:hypothetical protein